MNPVQCKIEEKSICFTTYTFKSRLIQTGEGTPGMTGYFEVQIVGGKLLHSKKVGVCPLQGLLQVMVVVRSIYCIPRLNFYVDEIY